MASTCSSMAPVCLWGVVLEAWEIGKLKDSKSNVRTTGHYLVSKQKKTENKANENKGKQEGVTGWLEKKSWNVKKGIRRQSPLRGSFLCEPNSWLAALPRAETCLGSPHWFNLRGGLPFPLWNWLQRSVHPLKLRYEKHDIRTSGRIVPVPRILWLWGARMVVVGS